MSGAVTKCKTFDGKCEVLAWPVWKLSTLKSKSLKRVDTFSSTGELMDLHLWTRDDPYTTNWRHLTKEFASTDSMDSVLQWLLMQFPFLILCSEYCLYSPLEGQKYCKTLQTLQQCKIEDNTILFVLTERQAKTAGRVGLVNRKNQCYMNASLQCLLHTPELMWYFLSEKHLEDVADDNPDSMGGKFAEQFRTLMMQVWMALEEPVSNNAFALKLGAYNESFADDEQHDAAEFLETALEALMEDCRRMHPTAPSLSQMIEERGGSDIPDNQLAKIYWQDHKNRFDSYITDVFHGQCRVLTVCPRCRYCHHSFNVFSVLHLGVPAKKRLIDFNLIDVCGLNKPKKYAVELASDLLMDDLYNAAMKLLGADELQSNSHFYFTQLKKKRFTFFERRDPVTKIEANAELLLFCYKNGYGPQSGGHKICILHEFKTQAQQSGLGSSSRKPKQKDLVYPLVLWMSDVEINTLYLSTERYENEDLSDLLLSMLLPLKNRNSENAKDQMFRNSLSPDQTAAYHKLQTQSNSGVPLSYPLPNQHLKVNCHPIQDQDSMGTSEDDGDDGSYRTAQSALGSPMDIDDNTSVGTFVVKDDTQSEWGSSSSTDQRSMLKHRQSQSFSQLHSEQGLETLYETGVNLENDETMPTATQPRPVEITKNKSNRQKTAPDLYIIKWGVLGDSLYDLQCLETPDEDGTAHALREKRFAIQRSPVTLNDCLEREFSPQRSDNGSEDNLWHCCSCSTRVDATKKVDLVVPPTVLVIGLKRFRFCEKRQKLMKIDQMVQYPLKGLNLNQYCGKPPGGEFVYDLYGVCLHSGEEQESGHYTSFVKTTDKNWYLFNDTQVSLVDESHAQREEAYLLFYRKRNSSLPGDRSALVSHAIEKDSDNKPHVSQSVRESSAQQLQFPISTVQKRSETLQSQMPYEAPKMDWAMSRGSTITAGPKKDTPTGRKRHGISTDTRSTASGQTDKTFMLSQSANRADLQPTYLTSRRPPPSTEFMAHNTAVREAEFEPGQSMEMESTPVDHQRHVSNLYPEQQMQRYAVAVGSSEERETYDTNDFQKSIGQMDLFHNDNTQKRQPEMRHRSSRSLGEAASALGASLCGAACKRATVLSSSDADRSTPKDTSLVDEHPFQQQTEIQSPSGLGSHQSRRVAEQAGYSPLSSVVRPPEPIGRSNGTPAMKRIPLDTKDADVRDGNQSGSQGSIFLEDPPKSEHKSAQRPTFSRTGRDSDVSNRSSHPASSVEESHGSDSKSGRARLRSRV